LLDSTAWIRSTLFNSPSLCFETSNLDNNPKELAMKCKEGEVRLSPLMLAVAAIAFLMAVTVLATETTVLQNQRLQVDQLDSSPNSFLVHRLTRGDIIEKPTHQRTVPVAPEDAYYRYRIETDAAMPAYLEGILMDDPRWFEAICRTV